MKTFKYLLEAVANFILLATPVCVQIFRMFLLLTMVSVVRVSNLESIPLTAFMLFVSVELCLVDIAEKNDMNWISVSGLVTSILYSFMVSLFAIIFYLSVQEINNLPSSIFVTILTILVIFWVVMHVVNVFFGFWGRKYFLHVNKDINTLIDDPDELEKVIKRAFQSIKDEEDAKSDDDDDDDQDHSHGGQPPLKPA